MKFEITKGSVEDFGGSLDWVTHVLCKKDDGRIFGAENFDYMCRAIDYHPGSKEFKIANPTQFEVIAERRPIAENRPITEPQPDTDGWIDWNGGDCPVEKGTLVDVMYRDGVKMFKAPAGELDLNPAHNRHAKSWAHSGMNADIVAYRLSKPDKPAEPESTAWNGEGLPPVGVMCEVFDSKQWHPCVVVGNYDGYAFAWNYDHKISVTSNAASTFRPIRSQEEIEREQAIAEMWAIIHKEDDEDKSVVESLYDAGYRKVGVLL